MRPPLFWRFVNLLRRWCERDERLLVEQWKDAYKPAPRKVIYMNLTVMRDARRKSMVA